MDKSNLTTNKPKERDHMAIMRINGDNFATKGDGSIRVFDCIGIEKDEKWAISFYGKKGAVTPFSILKKLKEKINLSRKTISIYPEHGVLLFLEGVFTSQDYYNSTEDDNSIKLTGIMVDGKEKNFLIKKKKVKKDKKDKK